MVVVVVVGWEIVCSIKHKEAERKKFEIEKKNLPDEMGKSAMTRITIKRMAIWRCPYDCFMVDALVVYAKEMIRRLCRAVRALLRRGDATIEPCKVFN